MLRSIASKSITQAVDTVAAEFVTYPCLWPLMDDDNIDALLVVDAIGWPVKLREWSLAANSSLTEKADEIFKTREE